MIKKSIRKNQLPLYGMKKLSLLFVFILVQFIAFSQCSVCAKTAQQLGEKPALGMNKGILYLMLAPFVIVAIIGYRWWNANKSN